MNLGLCLHLNLVFFLYLYVLFIVCFTTHLKKGLSGFI